MSKKTFEFEKVMTSDAARVWAVLAKLEAVAEWAPVITSCRVEGRGAGAIRHCVMADGTKLRERIIDVDVPGRVLKYSIEEGLPLDRYQGSFSVVERDGRGITRWSIEVEGEPAMIAQIEAMLASVAPAMLDGLDAATAKPLM